MSEEQKEPRQPLGDLFPIEKSDFYNYYLLEREEINKLKWVLSEQLGRDCGYEYAQWIWIHNHRDNWVKNRNVSGAHSI